MSLDHLLARHKNDHKVGKSKRAHHGDVEEDHTPSSRQMMEAHIKQEHTSGGSRAGRLHSGNSSVMNKILLAGLGACLIFLIILSVKFQSTAAMMDECMRKSGAFRFELDSTKEQLYSTRSKLRELDNEKGTLQAELDTAANKLVQMSEIKTTLKGELELLVKKYMMLKREKNSIASKFEMSRTEAKQLESQSQQLEGLLQTLKDGIKSLDDKPQA